MPVQRLAAGQHAVEFAENPERRAFLNPGNHRAKSVVNIFRVELKAVVLLKKKNAVWNEGFQAGQVLNSECPHPVGSPAAKEWMEGWGMGIRERGKAAALPVKNSGCKLKGFIRKWTRW